MVGSNDLDLLPIEAKEVPEPLLKLTLRAITPVALRGATQKRTAEVGAILGRARYWLRALLGSVTKDDGTPLSHAEVALYEAEVFGSTAWSPRFDIQFDAPTDKDRTEVERDNAYSYVIWPLRDKENDGDIQLHPWPAGSQFQFALRSASYPLDSARGRALAAALWCLFNLGGLGARTTRGFGALRVEAVTGKLADEFARLTPEMEVHRRWAPPQNPQTVSEAWFQFLAGGLIAAGEAVASLVGNGATPAGLTKDEKRYKQGTKEALPEWNSFRAGHWQLKLLSFDQRAPCWNRDNNIIPPPPIWSRPLVEISDRLSTYRQTGPRRSRVRRDRQGIKRTISISPTVKDEPQLIAARARADDPIDLKHDEFGLPRQAAHVMVTTKSGADRRTSPVMLRPVELNNGKIGILVLVFRSKFVRGGHQVVDSKKNHLADVEPVNWALPEITNFVREMTANSVDGKALVELS